MTPKKATRCNRFQRSPCPSKTHSLALQGADPEDRHRHVPSEVGGCDSTGQRPRCPQPSLKKCDCRCANSQNSARPAGSLAQPGDSRTGEIPMCVSDALRMRRNVRRQSESVNPTSATIFRTCVSPAVTRDHPFMRQQGPRFRIPGNDCATPSNWQPSSWGGFKESAHAFFTENDRQRAAKTIVRAEEEFDRNERN
jgi:hypothetical protein